MNRRTILIALDVAWFVAGAWWTRYRSNPPAPPEDDHFLDCARFVGGETPAEREHAVTTCVEAWRTVREIEKGQP